MFEAIHTADASRQRLLASFEAEEPPPGAFAMHTGNLRTMLGL